MFRKEITCLRCNKKFRRKVWCPYCGQPNYSTYRKTVKPVSKKMVYLEWILKGISLVVVTVIVFLFIWYSGGTGSYGGFFLILPFLALIPIWKTISKIRTKDSSFNAKRFWLGSLGLFILLVVPFILTFWLEDEVIEKNLLLKILFFTWSLIVRLIFFGLILSPIIFIIWSRISEDTHRKNTSKIIKEKRLKKRN